MHVNNYNKNLNSRALCGVPTKGESATKVFLITRGKLMTEVGLMRKVSSIIIPRDDRRDKITRALRYRGPIL